MGGHGVSQGSDTARNLFVFGTTVLASGGGVWGILRMLARTQKDFVLTASKRNNQLEERVATAEHDLDESETARRIVERKYQEAWLDRAELYRLLQIHKIDIPKRIRDHMEEPEDG